jgi:hypothetical protein
MIRNYSHQNPSNRFSWKGGQWPLVLLLAAAAVLFAGGCLWFQIPGSGNEAALKGYNGEPYHLSPDQSDLIRQRGYPQAFKLLFYEQLEPDGSQETVRQETWDYYSEGESYSFVNGELDRVDSIGVQELASLIPQPYIPEQFTAYMTLEDVLVSSGLEDFIEVPLEKEFLEGGNLYYGSALSFGLVDGELRYLEALAILEE